MALAAFIAPTTTEPGTVLAAASGASPAQWPPLPPLLPREAIAVDTWDVIRRVNAFGASGIDAGIATLWRHLAHWPALLALIHCAFAPLQSCGLIDEANARLVARSETEGARMAHLRPTLPTLSPKALAAITGYVRSPTQVARMVAIGHALASWLARLQPSDGPHGSQRDCLNTHTQELADDARNVVRREPLHGIVGIGALILLPRDAPEPAAGPTDLSVRGNRRGYRRTEPPHPRQSRTSPTAATTSRPARRSSSGYPA